MILYHGTAVDPERILSEGLTPRGERGTNWPAHPSRPDCVYLTVAYALYFAIAAGKDGAPFSVVEVDMTGAEDCMVPDEDALAQAFSFGRSLADATAFYREKIHEWRKMWKWSLAAMSNCAHLGPIPPSRITRIATVDIKSADPYLINAALDPAIGIMNYRICGGNYHELTTRLFAPDRGVTIKRLRDRRSRPFLCRNRAGRKFLAFASDPETARHLAKERGLVRKPENCSVSDHDQSAEAGRLSDAGYVGLAVDEPDMFGKQRLMAL